MRNKDRKPLLKQIDKSLDFLNKNQFSKRKDILEEYSSGSMLYFLQLNDKQFLVVNHYGYRSTVEDQGLDLWLSHYNTAGDIGMKKASSITSLKFGVQFPEDEDLIKKEIDRCSDRFMTKG
jgi:hypothetical protein